MPSAQMQAFRKLICFSPQRSRSSIIVVTTAAPTLPDQFQAELHLPADGLRAGQFPKRGVAHREAGGSRSRQIERRRIREVERLRAEFQALPLGEEEVL